MIYKYEIACIEAGLSQEKIAEIRRMFDKEKKRLKRENQSMEKNNIRYFAVDNVKDGNEFDQYAIVDLNVDVEMEAIKKSELIKLKKVVLELTEDEREFLRICYEDARESDTRISKTLGIPRQTVQYRKKKLLMKNILG